MNNYLHDTHFHLDLMNDFYLVADEIEKNKIYTIAVTNLPVLYSTLIKKLNNKYKYIRPALGFHPELLDQYQRFIPQMWECLPNARYIGEVGLDFKIGIKFKKLQINFFEELIDRSHNLGNKILTIHSRNSAEDIISIIGDKFSCKYILHWYSGNKKTLNKAIENGAYFSINYAMVNSISGQNIIKNIPINRLLLESDGPFVKLNKSVFTPNEVNHIVKKIALIKKQDELEITMTLFNNFKSIIGSCDIK